MRSLTLSELALIGGGRFGIDLSMGPYYPPEMAFAYQPMFVEVIEVIEIIDTPPMAYYYVAPMPPSYGPFPRSVLIAFKGIGPRNILFISFL